MDHLNREHVAENMNVESEGTTHAHRDDGRWNLSVLLWAAIELFPTFFFLNNKVIGYKSELSKTRKLKYATLTFKLIFFIECKPAVRKIFRLTRPTVMLGLQEKPAALSVESKYL